MTQKSLNQSHWVSEIETHSLEPALQEVREADVAMVGGGYTSLVAAWYLKRARPELEVAVLESDYVGYGASGRNAGMVLANMHTSRAREMGEEVVRRTYQETIQSVEIMEEIAREAGFDYELERSGFLQIALYPAHMRRLEAMQKAYARRGVDLELWDRTRMQSEIRTPRFIGGLLFPKAAMIHPGKLIAGLKKAALQQGVKIYEGTPVTRLVQGRAAELFTPQGRLRARQVVLGLNAYLRASGLSPRPDPSVPLKSFIILTEPLSDSQWQEIGWAGRQGYCDLRRIHNYVRLTGKRILFGGRVLYHFGLSEPEHEDPIFKGLERELLLTFPSLRGVPIERRWCGPVSITFRRTPILKQTGRHNNIFLAVGYSGMGVSLGTLCGRALADLVQGQNERWQDLLYWRDRPLPLPPEPFRWIGFKSSFYGMKLLDWWDSRSK